MECIHCKGKMARKAVPFQVDRKGYHLTLAAVPAWVCMQCGPYFESKEIGAVRSALTALDKRTKELSVTL